jgi:myo-inositol 2-dehydrogenase / D-chiro-inositol 1-dehydrogenase
MESSPFKICVIGCGEIAFGYHGPAYVRYAADYPNTELSGCCSRTLNKAALFAEKFGFRNCYTDFIEMVDAEQPSVVCINVPPEAICEITCAMLQKGIPTLLEKPPGMTVAETDRMIAAAEANRTSNQVAFNRRFIPLTKALINILEQRYQQDDIHYLQIEFTRVNRGNEDFSTTAIHGIDLARFIARSDFASIDFHYQEFYRHGIQGVNTYMEGIFTSGAIAHLSFCPVAGIATEKCAVHTYNSSFYLQLPIWNELDNFGRLIHYEYGKTVFELTGIESVSTTYPYVLNGFYAENETFFNHIRENRQPVMDIRQSRQSVEIMAAMRERRSEFIAR